jgi:hypothetical protein
LFGGYDRNESAISTPGPIVPVLYRDSD